METKVWDIKKILMVLVAGIILAGLLYGAWVFITQEREKIFTNKDGIEYTIQTQTENGFLESGTEKAKLAYQLSLENGYLFDDKYDKFCETKIIKRNKEVGCEQYRFFYEEVDLTILNPIVRKLILSVPKGAEYTFRIPYAQMNPNPNQGFSEEEKNSLVYLTVKIPENDGGVISQ